LSVDNHRFLVDGDMVTHHMTIRGRHVASTMPLLAGIEPTGREVSWTFIDLWRVAQGKIVEHWACRDDLGLLVQIGAWPPPARRSS
jgi:lactoylglutathione lyase